MCAYLMIAHLHHLLERMEFLSIGNISLYYSSERFSFISLLDRNFFNRLLTPQKKKPAWDIAGAKH